MDNKKNDRNNILLEEKSYQNIGKLTIKMKCSRAE